MIEIENIRHEPACLRSLAAAFPELALTAAEAKGLQDLQKRLRELTSRRDYFSRTSHRDRLLKARAAAEADPSEKNMARLDDLEHTSTVALDKQAQLVVRAADQAAASLTPLVVIPILDRQLMVLRKVAQQIEEQNARLAAALGVPPRMEYVAAALGVIRLVQDRIRQVRTGAANLQFPAHIVLGAPPDLL